MVNGKAGGATAAAPEGPWFRVEYRLTPEERSKAETAAMVDQAAGGSVWAYALILVGAIALAGLRVWMEIAQGEGLYWVGVFVVIWIVVFVWVRRSAKAREAAARETTVLELSA